MSRITWNGYDQNTVEVGADRGVLYFGGAPGVPWNGLVAVNEAPEGARTDYVYVDGQKVQAVDYPSSFAAKVDAYTYPEELDEHDAQFNLTYRTLILGQVTKGYKLHLVYNAVVKPSTKNYKADSLISLFSWDLTTTPVKLANVRPTAHIVIDSTISDPSLVARVETILYGNELYPPRMPTMHQLIRIFGFAPIFEVTDHQTGEFTVEGPDDMVYMVGTETFELNSESVIFLDADTYQVSSL